MADFDDNLVNTAAQNLGVHPDFVRQQLIAEGHNVAPPAASLTGGMGIAPAGWMAPDQVDQPVPQADPNVIGPPPAAPQQWMVNQSNLQMPPPPEAAPPGTQVPRKGIRATGAGLQQPAGAPGMGGAGGGMGGGGMSRVRSMFDKRDQQLTGEADRAAGEVAQGQERLGQLQEDAFGYEQQRLGNQADAAERRANLYAGYEQEAARAQQAEEVARQKEDTVLAANAQAHKSLVDDYANTRIRDRPTSTRFASAFGMAFAGIADSLNAAVGNRSQFLDGTMRVVDQEIDRDVQEQLQAIDQKKGAVDDSERSLSRLSAGIGDRRAFRAATRAAAYEQMAARAQTIAANSDSETAKIAAAAALPEFQARAQQARVEASTLDLQDKQKRLRDSADDRLGFEAKSALLAQAKAGTGPKPEKPLSTSAALHQIGQPTEADVAKAKEIASGSAGIIDNIHKLGQQAKEGMTLSPDKRATASRRILALKSQFNGNFGDGTAPNEAQLEELSDAFLNPTEANLGSAQRQFEVFMQDALDQTNAKLRPYNHQLGGADDDFVPE